MRAVCQRVSEARVTVDGAVAGEIGAGPRRTARHRARRYARNEAGRLAAKVAVLRIFENEDGKFDRSLVDVEGEALVVSQFTLIADTQQGQPAELRGRRAAGARPSRSTSTSVRPWRQGSPDGRPGRLRGENGRRARQRRAVTIVLG